MDILKGPVFRPGDEGYDDERAGFQALARHRPDVIVGATDAADVRAAVVMAAANGLPVAVQATGHGMPMAADGGLLISTRRMTGVRVDAETATARIEAGVRWARVIEEAARHGLAPLSGSAPSVGAVSYTLGGGLGLMARRYGYAVDQVRAVEVVTADGVLREVTAATEPDLFWALLGGRGNFGVVTALEIGLVPVTSLYGGGLFFDLATDVVKRWAEWTLDLPEEMTSSIAVIPFPDARWTSPASGPWSTATPSIRSASCPGSRRAATPARCARCTRASARHCRRGTPEAAASTSCTARTPRPTRSGWPTTRTTTGGWPR
ncbi:FAD-binding oxidoreductase [Nonomuraea sp. NPDC050680]|uniref:FAD-binding oxidoreductase n=1 Tax=Nonomuraea sp. NPDC050680 TaxID=3154630 RepID=UPI00340D3DDB